MADPGSPILLLVHGVGLGIWSFDRLMHRAGEAGMTVTAPLRRGYDGRTPSADLDHHVDDLEGHVEELVGQGRPVVVAGVSGGATLALALAVRDPQGLKAVVVHEPLIGPAAPAQHAVITDSIRCLADGKDEPLSSPGKEPDTDDVESFMERLVTPATWQRFAADERREICRHAATVRIEVEGFADFSLDPEELATAGSRTVWTVGRRSPAWRREAAEVGGRFGATVLVVDAVHTPQIEAPAEWLDVIMAAGAVS